MPDYFSLQGRFSFTHPLADRIVLADSFRAASAWAFAAPADTDIPALLPGRPFGPRLQSSGRGGRRQRTRRRRGVQQLRNALSAVEQHRLLAFLDAGNVYLGSSRFGRRDQEQASASATCSDRPVGIDLGHTDEDAGGPAFESLQHRVELLRATPVRNSKNKK